MNIYLVPYTWARHIVVAVNVGAAALIAWWLALLWVVLGAPIMHSLGFLWLQAIDGLFFLVAVGSAISFASVLAEGLLRRRAVHWRLLYAVIAMVVTALVTILGWGVLLMLTPYLGSKDMYGVLADPSLVSLRYKLLMWAWAGVASGMGPFVGRLSQWAIARWGYGMDHDDAPERAEMSALAASWVQHLLSGLIASTLAAAVWHMLGFYWWMPGNLYLATGWAALVWGTVHGLLVWAVPDDLYAGWIRVLSAERYGLRIPIDRPDFTPAERFVGHYPRGLDMYLPAEQGVAELHASFVVDREFNYAVRGLSQAPTLVKRPLEAIDLHYAEHRPAPLETEVHMEDRIIMGQGTQQCTIEFLLLPKEEM